MKKVLVLCTGNSCRSQIAEAYLRHFAGEKAAIYSAGVETHGVNPRAISTMKEDGIDISQHTSNIIDEYVNIDFDFVIATKINCFILTNKSDDFTKYLGSGQLTAKYAIKTQATKFDDIDNVIESIKANFDLTG